MQKDAQKKHQEVLDMIEKLSEATASERASTVSNSSAFHRLYCYWFIDEWKLFSVLQ
jgi:hypothetical protein